MLFAQKNIGGDTMEGSFVKQVGLPETTPPAERFNASLKFIRLDGSQLVSGEMQFIGFNGLPQIRQAIIDYRRGQTKYTRGWKEVSLRLTRRDCPTGQPVEINLWTGEPVH